MKNKYQEALDVVKKINLRSEHYVQFEEDNIENVYEEEINILQKLVDKETPKKVIYKFIKKPYEHIWYCPNCKEKIRTIIYQDTEEDTGKLNYCPECGQKLDWSDNDEN